MCPQTAANQHNTPVLSRIETDAPVPLHHRLSSLSCLCPSSASNCSVPPAAVTSPQLLETTSTMHPSAQAAGPVSSTCAICALPPAEKLPNSLPEWQLSPWEQLPQVRQLPSGWNLTYKWASKGLGASWWSNSPCRTSLGDGGQATGGFLCSNYTHSWSYSYSKKTKTRLCCYMLDIGAMCSMCDMCVHTHEYEQGSQSTVAYNMRQWSHERHTYDIQH